MAAAAFTLCRVPHGERMYWYALFRDPVTGSRTNKKSVEVLRTKLGLPGTTPITRRTEAESICAQALASGLVFAKRKKIAPADSMKLSVYLAQFYDWDVSDYIKRRLVIDPQSLSKDYMATRRNLIQKHVLPLLDKSLLLKDVALKDLEDLQYELAKAGDLSKSTINMALQAVTNALKEAQRRGLLPSGTSLSIKPLKAKSRLRGILTDEEIEAYLAFAKKQDNQRMYLSALLSLFTGMRSGELRALSVEQIKDGMIVVDRAYADRQGTKSPKGKKTRVVPCPRFLCDALKAFAHTNPYRSKETLVFWSPKGGGHVSSHYFCTLFHAVLIESGILTAEQIEERYLTFHSFRHMANTLLRGSVDEYVLRLTIGHSSEQLSDIYTHLTSKALKSVQDAQARNIMPLLGDLGAQASL